MQKIPRSKWLQYSLLLVIVYLVGRSFLYNEPLSQGLAVGIILGLFLGAVFESWKLLETKEELAKQNTQSQTQTEVQPV